jgi:hypothetical protein
MYPERDYVLFEKFAYEMYQEYSRHYPKNNDSWKSCAPEYLVSLLNDSIGKHSLEELKQNPSHFIDIANFAFFCYHGFSKFVNKGEAIK